MAYLVLVIIGVFLLGIYLKLRHINAYWQRNGVSFVRGSILLGNMKETCTFKKPFITMLHEVYNHPSAEDSAVVGFHVLVNPSLILRDLDLIKAVLVTDFAAFSNRQSASDIHNDMIGGANVFFAKNPFWKKLRQRLTPGFTRSKTKQMFELLNEVSNELNKHFLSVSTNETTKILQEHPAEISTRYLLQAIGSCVFGIGVKSLRDPNHDFITKSRKMFKFTLSRVIQFTSAFLVPKLVYLFRFKTFGNEANQFLRESINCAIDERVKTGQVRNDLIDYLLALRNEDADKPLSTTDEIVFRGDALVGQAAIFFAAGFEDASAIMSFGLYELSRRPDMQRRIREEIDGVLQSNDGELTYELVSKMKYLGMVIAETLRMYPSLAFIDRECTLPNDSEGYDLRQYSIDFKIPSGMSIFISIHAIHMDPKYWDQPEIFDPERFAPENKDKIIPFSYLPFGKGPHNCIAERFGDLLLRMAFIQFFRNHRLAPCESTPEKPKFDPFSLLVQMDGGIRVNVIRDPLL